MDRYEKLFAHSGRVFVTLVMVTMAGLLGWHLWDYYMNAPWTRDGKIVRMLCVLRRMFLDWLAKCSFMIMKRSTVAM